MSRRIGQPKNRQETIKQLVFLIIWYVLAFVFGGIGLAFFLKENTSLGGWFIFGGFCCVPLITVILKQIVSNVKSGYKSGKNSVDVTVYRDGSTSSRNHPIRGAIGGLIGGILGSVLVGPVLLGIYIILNLMDVTTLLQYMKIYKKEDSKKQ